MIQVSDEFVKELLERYDREDVLGPGGVLDQIKRRFIESALDGELTTHLGYERHAVEGRGSGNSRNGTFPKTLKGTDGEITIDHPRDRAGTFEPQLVPKGVTHLPGFDDRIISLYARGLTVREIQAHLGECYAGLEVSPDLISSVTDSVLDDLEAWQTRPLDRLYMIVWLDAIVVKVRDGRTVRNKAAYLAIGVNIAGRKEALGLWLAEGEGTHGKNESAKFWLGVLNELKTRGVRDILVCCCDGLSGFPAAITAVFPDTWVQTCVVHVVRNSLAYVAYKDRRAVARDLRGIYTAPDEDAGLAALDAFEATWAGRYPKIPQIWQDKWDLIVPMWAFPPEIRKIMYTTNIIESVNAQLRKVSSHRGLFPTDKAVKKLLYLVLHNIEKKWSQPVRDWPAALNQFAILFPERLDITEEAN